MNHGGAHSAEASERLRQRLDEGRRVDADDLIAGADRREQRPETVEQRADAEVGAHRLAGLQDIAAGAGGEITNVRGRGLMCAFDLPDTARRDAVLGKAREEGLLGLSSGPNSIRFRPALTITREDVDEGLKRLRAGLA